MFETTGLDDTDHLAVIGALQNIQRTGVLSRAPAKPGWMNQNAPQGVSMPAEELDYLPLDGVDYTNNTGATEDYEAQLDSFPQRPFRGERLVLQAILVAVVGGARDALFQMVITPALYVGAVQVGSTQGQMPASAFGPQAFGVRLSMPAAGQGTRIYLPFRFLGLQNLERIIISGGLFGRAVR